MKGGREDRQVLVKDTYLQLDRRDTFQENSWTARQLQLLVIYCILENYEESKCYLLSLQKMITM